MSSVLSRASGSARHWAALVLLMIAAYPAQSQSFPDRVAAFMPGVNSGFGQAYYPTNVLGAPHGNTNPQTPNFSQQDLLSLGTGGEIVLEFTSTEIVNGPGDDFTVFENPVQPISNPDQSFVDSATVSVSDDGTSWVTFPFHIVSISADRLYYKSNYVGLAGVQPTFSSPTNGISPFDRAVSGGDGYDLTSVGLTRARFIRIKDTGTTTVSPTIDLLGHIVNDYGNQLDPDPLSPGVGIAAGFDLDGIAAIHTTPRTTAVRREDWVLYE
ncbi:MAG: cell surface protein [Candidatus Sumerlaeaceae bacterium]